jgi:hypothetical protein
MRSMDVHRVYVASNQLTQNLPVPTTHKYLRASVKRPDFARKQKVIFRQAKCEYPLSMSFRTFNGVI